MRFCRPMVFLCFFLLVGLISPLRSFGQFETATLSGRISDPQGASVPKAQIEIVNIDTNVSSTTETNNEGIYVFSGVKPGRYRLHVLKDGFHEIIRPEFTLNTQDDIQQNFRLQVGSVSESVTVEANGVNINTSDAAVSTVVGQQFVTNIPLNGRSFQDLIALTPGVSLGAANGNPATPGTSGEFSVNGQRTEQNYFTVDGVSVNVGTSPGDFGFGAGFAGAVPGETVLGTTQSMVSVDALQEFRATTSTFSAEYGRAPGGQFALTTRSGTNDWHGSAFDYFRNEALDANNWFSGYSGVPKQKERQNDFGGTLGGPIVMPSLYNGKDKTFFFFSYEGLRLWSPMGAIDRRVPDQALREHAPAALQPLLNAFPLPNRGEDGLGDGMGIYTVGQSFPSSVDSVSVRVDHKVSNRVQMFGRYANTETEALSYYLALKLSTPVNYRSLTVGATTTVTSHQTNNLRFNITNAVSAFDGTLTNLGGATPFNVTSIPGPHGEPFPNVASYFQFQFCPTTCAGFYLPKTRNSQRQYNVTDSQSWTHGRHNADFGLDWRRLSTYAVPYVIQEYVDFQSDNSILSGVADSASVVSASTAPVEPVYTNFSAFAQDHWELISRLSLSLGLRWDVNPAPSNSTGPSPYTLNQITNLSTAQLAPAGTPLWKTEWNAFAPRFGFAYQVHQAPSWETVLRGGFGVFYDMGNARGSLGLGGIGFTSSNNFNSVAFPLTSGQVTLPPPSVAAPYDSSVVAFDPNLRLPYTLEWNFALEQAVERNSALSVTYVGSAGRRLLTTFSFSPGTLGNPNFGSQTPGLSVVRNGASSNYNALQIRFQRRMPHGLEALASYTLSHSIDDASSNFYIQELERGSSDFDIRHNFQAALVYVVPNLNSHPTVSSIVGQWNLSARISAMSAIPVDLVGTQSFDPISQAFVNYHPNLVQGEPIYLYGSQYPGGRAINYGAFSPAPPNVEGDVPRNFARGFGSVQTNLALQRTFPVHERLHLLFRAEAFNLLNHPNFGNVQNFIAAGPCGAQSLPTLSCFGIAQFSLNTALGGLNPLYQTGGPRSLQIALKLNF